jgi:ABC-type uncharacterized transport system auxiliary subunit
LIAARVIALSSLVLTGCSGGLHSDSPATQVYVLRAATAPRSDLTQLLPNASLHVNRPIAGPGLESDHIMLVQSGHRMSFYTGSRWPANVSSVIEALTVETLRAGGVWSTVQDSSSIFSADYMLQIVIRRFEADYSRSESSPEVHVTLDCTVGRRAGREVIASFMAEGSVTAAANHLGDVVAAFEQASSQALAQLSVHTAEAVGAAQKVETPVPSIKR